MNAYIVPGATVLAAVLAFLGVLIANKTRKPVQTQDLWQENRELRGEVRGQASRIDLIEEKFEKRDEERQRVIGVLSGGFAALLRYLDRVRPEWGNGEMPPFSPSEAAAIDPAREIHHNL